MTLDGGLKGDQCLYCRALGLNNAVMYGPFSVKGFCLGTLPTCMSRKKTSDSAQGGSHGSQALDGMEECHHELTTALFSSQYCTRTVKSRGASFTAQGFPTRQSIPMIRRIQRHGASPLPAWLTIANRLHN